MERGIAIVGSCRSGTSSVAGALAKMGVYFGRPEHLYSADSHNEGGYWEHRAVNAAVRKFHLSLNLAGLDLDPIPDDWRERPMTREMLANTVRVFRTHLAGRELWGWKDPQASTLLPFVKTAYEGLPATLSTIICVRNPLDVAASQAARQGVTEMQAMGGWLLSTLAALRDSAGAGRAVVVYEDLLRRPDITLERLADALELAPSQDERIAATASIRTDLAHRNEDTEGLKRYPKLIRATYELSRQAASDPQWLLKGEFDGAIGRLWSEWSAWHDLFARPPFPEATFSLSWGQGGTKERDLTKYRPSRGWQTVRANCAAPTGSRVSLNIYPLPAIVWIRSAVWRQDGVEVTAELEPGVHGQLDEHDGIRRVWVFHGLDQVGVRAPAWSAPFELELEILVETGNVISGLTFQELARRTESG